MCFEVAVLNPLAASWDAMDAAMLTRKSQRQRRTCGDVETRIRIKCFIGQGVGRRRGLNIEVVVQRQPLSAVGCEPV